MLNSIQDIIVTHNLKGKTFLLAVSGGVDSMVLLDVFNKLKLKFYVAHCNFQLRGEESDKDEQLVVETTRKIGVEAKVKRFDTQKEIEFRKQGVQQIARDLRYTWFNQLKEELKYDVLVTAHHQNDNVENFIMAAAKGKGLEALSGMHLFENNILRPLLGIKKKEILAYSSTSDIVYRNDASNLKNDYDRNFVRNEVMPLLSNKFDEVDKQIALSQSFLQETTFFIKQQLEKYISKYVDFKSDSIELKKAIEYEYLAKQYLLKYGFVREQLQKVVEVLKKNKSGKVFTSEKYNLEVSRGVLILSEKGKEFNAVEKVYLSIEELKIDFNIEELSSTPNFKNKELLFFDAEQVKFPITIRKWKEGDKFSPLGLKGNKLLSDLFTDLKLSLSQKKETKVWVDGDGLIIMVYPYRISNKIKLHSESHLNFVLKLG